jgi:hypothetical protein
MKQLQSCLLFKHIVFRFLPHPSSVLAALVHANRTLRPP